MAERKDPPCQGILELDRENLCVVDGVVFEKDSFQRYIREEHRPHPKDRVRSDVSGAADADAASAGICSGSFDSSFYSSFSGSFSSFSSVFSSFTSSYAFSGSSSSQGGYGLDLI